MELNADFSQRASVHAGRTPWVASPMAGVERRMLDRIGDEVARATSLVRYAPGSHFSPHIHEGGEEFFVLEGVFQDEHGDYPAGCYVRNPPTSRHRPGAPAGCTIFVKLWQFDPSDRQAVTIDTRTAPWRPGQHGATSADLPLFSDDVENVRLERWPAGARVQIRAPGGIEILVLTGAFEEAGEAFAPWSWLRLPGGVDLDARSGRDGCTVWIKTGHLRRALPLPSGLR